MIMEKSALNWTDYLANHGSLHSELADRLRLEYGVESTLRII